MSCRSPDDRTVGLVACHSEAVQIKAGSLASVCLGMTVTNLLEFWLFLGGTRWKRVGWLFHSICRDLQQRRGRRRVEAIVIAFVSGRKVRIDERVRGDFRTSAPIRWLPTFPKRLLVHPSTHHMPICPGLPRKQSFSSVLSESNNGIRCRGKLPDR